MEHWLPQFRCPPVLCESPAPFGGPVSFGHQTWRGPDSPSSWDRAIQRRRSREANTWRHIMLNVSIQISRVLANPRLDDAWRRTCRLQLKRLQQGRPMALCLVPSRTQAGSGRQRNDRYLKLDIKQEPKNKSNIKP
ncbi:hypothetical protein AB1N83_011549 [Pleurotus pulmonarius]